MNIRAILYNEKMTEQIWVGFSLSNKPKRSENTPDLHYARSYDRDIKLQFTSVSLL